MNPFELIEEGASVAQIKKAFEAASLSKEDTFQLFETAATYNRTDLMAWLVKTGVDPRDVSKFNTPLGNAARSGSREALLWLLDNGAEVDSKCEEFGTTALQEAVSSDQVDMVKLLLERGADPEQMSGNPPRNPLSAAMLHSSTKVEAYLRSIGMKEISAEEKKVDVESPAFMRKKIADPVEWFQQKWFFVFDHVNQKGLKGLGEKNKVLFLVGYMIDQLTGEGAMGFYANPSGAYATQIPAALEKIGAKDYARMLRAINALFPLGKPATDDDIRCKQIKKLPKRVEALGEVLETAFKKNARLLKQLYDFYHAK